MTIDAPGRVTGPGQPDIAAFHIVEQQFLAAMGDPEKAPNGAAAAQELLDPNNSFFNNPLLYKDDPGYNPEVARAGAFVATLKRHQDDPKFLAQFLDALGPQQENKLANEAIDLQYPVINDDGSFASINEEDARGVISGAEAKASAYDRIQS